MDTVRRIYILGYGTSDGRSVVGDEFGYNVSMNSDDLRIIVDGPRRDTFKIYEYDGTYWGGNNGK